MFPSPGEVVILVINSAAIAVALGFIIFLVIKRHDKVIMYADPSVDLGLSRNQSNNFYSASSPTFLFAQLVGITLLFISIYFALWNRVSTPSCHLQVWFLGLGFTVTFGALVVKVWMPTF